VKLAVVVQRYGIEISGGAELHARYIAEHLARRHDVEVLTTCARDYVTWRNELPAGEERVNGIVTRRFPVHRPRVPEEFGRTSQTVFDGVHSVNDELAWLESEGPASPSLIAHVRARASEFDYFIFFSYRYYLAWHGARAVPGKAILVPTAERDPAIGVSLFPPLFRGVRAIMYNSLEERAMIRAACGNDDVPGIVVGVGSELPRRPEPDRFRCKFGVRGPFVVYVGRIDENKGCKQLFTFFQRHVAARRTALTLVLAGYSILPIPEHPQIRHLGFVTDEDKFDAIAAAEALVMPSFFESLSMVALEAWGLGRPVLANGHCDVLRGQCLRSNAGLFYDDYDEFNETLQVLTSHPRLNRAMGENGRAYHARHYAWPVVEKKYEDILARLDQENREGRRAPAMAPLPGWFARRRRTLPPAQAILDALPAGAVVPPRQREAPRGPRHDASRPPESGGPRGRPRSQTAARFDDKGRPRGRRQR
jgi:glycosyltransferase involved in cell wall biosynthesis